MARILLIEDNRDHLELMAYLLRSHGHLLLSAGSATSGYSMIRCCEEIDLIICDINLGRESGIDLVRAMRKSGRLSHIPIVAVTAGSMGQAPQAFAAGFNGYILKPIEPVFFLAEINRFLSGDSAAFSRPAENAIPAVRPEEDPAIILAVDDKPANLDLIQALLQPLGHRILSARGVEEAISRARRESPTLVLTDVHMGDGTGFDLIRIIQKDETLRHTPWLVTSATYLSMDARAQEIQLNDSNFILQPWEPQSFIAKVRERLKSKNGGTAAKIAQASR